MQPNTIVAEREGELGGERVAMSFDSNSLAHIMSVLTDLYSDPELAVIREYSTNALDSHVAAGVDRPIEIQTPSPLSPYFKVKDFGLGMDLEGIKNIYSKYGASTKRNTDSQVGMLGLGCKSALTYTSQFNLVGVKDGIKTHVVISRTEDGSGVMEIVDESPTDEPNGVEIIVPVKRGNEFESKSKNFFSFWEPGTVLVNGQEPEMATGRNIGDNITFVKGMKNDVVVMGNVPYPCDRRLYDGYRGWSNQFGIVARVGIGEVNFTPSRESLHYTTLTESTLSTLERIVKMNLTATVRKDIEEAETHDAAFKAYHDWKGLLSTGYRTPFPDDVTYKGQPIPEWIDGDALIFEVRSTRNAVYKRSKVAVDTYRDCVIITEYPHEDKVASHYREKIRLWLEENAEKQQRNVLLIAGSAPEKPEWYPNTTVVKWDDVRTSTKIIRAKREKKPVSYEALDDNGYIQNITDIPVGKIPVLVTPKNRPSVNSAKYLTSLRPDVMVVLLQTARWDKFKTIYPQAVSLESVVKDLCQDKFDALTTEDFFILKMDWFSQRKLSNMDAAKVDDPDIKVAIAIAKQNGRAQSDAATAYRKAAAIAEDIKLHDFKRVGRANPSLDKYPLLAHMEIEPETIEHAQIYMNAIYSLTQN